MNWLGLQTVAFVGAILGAVLGGVAYAAALASGWDAPYLVGIAMGFGVMIASPDRSGMRGLLIASGAIWAAALVQSRVGPHASAGLLGFHATLTRPRLAAFFGCALVAFVLARTSTRRDAPLRSTGS